MNKRILALGLASVLLLGGCGELPVATEDTDKQETIQVKLEQPISSGSKWINSSIVGAIDENTQVRAQDDFYTYVNKDKILESGLDTNNCYFLPKAEDVVKKRKIMIVSGENDPEANKEVQIDIPKEYVEHYEELLENFVSAINDWDTRNALRREPLKEYIVAIENISNLSEMTDYILDKDNNNFTGDSLISIEADTLNIRPEKYTVILGRKTDYLLESRDQYVKINSVGMQRDHVVEAEVIDTLTDMGYTESDANRILKNCYKFEGKLADATFPEMITDKIGGLVRENSIYTYEQVQKMQGDYPLCELMEKYGFDNTEEYCVPFPEFVIQIGQMYSESNLEYIKDYYIVHTINESMGFLDRDAYELATMYEGIVSDEVKVQVNNPDGDVKEIEINDEWDVVLQNYVAKYLGEPLEATYLSRYCTPEEKEYLIEITNELTEQYVDIINSEDWMMKDTKEAATEKLACMKVHVLYPDTFSDYSDLQLSKEDTLVDMVRKINQSALLHEAQKVGTVRDSSEWNITEKPSTVVNANYVPGENAIYIYAGITSVPEIFDMEKPFEYNLARIGTIIGHEISHGFDKNGINFNKNGTQDMIMGSLSASAFVERARDLEKYYDTMTPGPDMATLSGSKLEDEAIADMGGVKACLAIAETREEFDYDLFFKSYADLWCEKTTYTNVLLGAKKDPHPQSFLRVNVTLSQFDKFLEVYDVKEGDGMYVAPEKRIAVW